MPARIAVLGLGYVGCVTAACFASLGHRVSGVDRDRRKLEKLTSGRAPFYEPGLEPIVSETIRSGALSVCEDLGGCIDQCDVAMICVGTPSEPNGNMSLAQLQRVCQEISAYLPQRDRPLIVVIRSTVFPGTCEQVVLPALAHHPMAQVVVNPEFLREGTAVADFLNPSLVVVGGGNLDAVTRVASLYDSLRVKPVLVSLGSAEMIKYACNCFHAVKISFANEIGTLCGHLNIPPVEVMETLCADVRLNTSPAYLKPGFAFGGSCLPKDLRALTYRASRMDLSLPMLGNVIASNQAHLERAFHAVLSLPAQRIGIFGLAFKEDTDDLRESPVIALVEYLTGKGRELRIFDPQIRMDQIYGQNQQFAIDAVPHIGRLMTNTLQEMLDAADQVIVTQRPHAHWQQKIDSSGKPTLCLADLLQLARTASRSAADAIRSEDLASLSRALSESRTPADAEVPAR